MASAVTRGIIAIIFSFQCSLIDFSRIYIFNYRCSLRLTRVRYINRCECDHLYECDNWMFLFTYLYNTGICLFLNVFFCTLHLLTSFVFWMSLMYVDSVLGSELKRGYTVCYTTGSRRVIFVSCLIVDLRDCLARVVYLVVLCSFSEFVIILTVAGSVNAIYKYICTYV